MKQEGGAVKAWLLLSNAIMCLGWARVLAVFLFGSVTQDEDSCSEQLPSAVSMALYLSFLELFNALVGFTRSKPHQVLLFAVVRFGVELLVAPMLPCTSWQHILTTVSWSLGDTVRFGCFAADTIWSGSYMAKAVRYTVGPLLFPFGASGEMFMVIAGAQDGRPKMYLAALLWPAGFYPLYTQLLKQRKKFMAKSKSSSSSGVAEIKQA